MISQCAMLAQGAKFTMGVKLVCIKCVCRVGKDSEDNVGHTNIVHRPLIGSDCNTRTTVSYF